MHLAKLLLPVCFPLLLTIQAIAQTYFKDVTTTHVPDAPKLHALGSTFTDVDKDGDLDVALAVELGVNRLYLNDGEGHLTWKKGVFGDGEYDSEHVEEADFNQDGHVDFMFVAEDDREHQLFFGNGSGEFSDVTNSLPAMSEGNGLAVGDVNGDELPDILVGNTGESDPEAEGPYNRNFLWLNDPDNPGNFIDASDSHLPLLNDDTQAIRLADLDDDGDPDMVVGNENAPNRLLINDGSGHFTDETDRLELVTPMHTRQVHVSDFTGDGRLDIVFFNLTSNNGGWEKDPQVRLLVQQENGQYLDETADRLPYNTFSAYEGIPIDLEEDGDMDIVVGPIQIPGFIPLRFRAYINDGDGFFEDMTHKFIPEGSSGRGWGMEVGDLNGDGKNDLFSGGWGTQARLLLTGN